MIKITQMLEIKSSKSPTLDPLFDTGVVSVQYNPRIDIPKEAHIVEVHVTEAKIWNLLPNITTVNNKITVSGAFAGSPYVLTIPTGLYSLNQLSASIGQLLTNAGAPTTSGPLIELISDSATQKVLFRANYIGVTIDISMADSIAGILGFGFVILGPSVVVGETFTASNSASLAPIQYYKLRCTLANEGIRSNNEYDSIIAIIPISAKTGSQIVYTPFNPDIVNANSLKGTKVSKLVLELTNEDGDRVFIPNEIFSASIALTYTIDSKYL